MSDPHETADAIIAKAKAHLRATESGLDPYAFALGAMHGAYTVLRSDYRAMRRRALRAEADVDHLVRKIEHGCVDANCDECEAKHTEDVRAIDELDAREP